MTAWVKKDRDLESRALQLGLPSVTEQPPVMNGHSLQTQLLT
jgi:hypothetical protein